MTVFETKRARSSKAGDGIRQGRVAERSQQSAGKLHLRYVERSDGCFFVMCAAVELGVICRQPQGSPRPGWNFLCFLPGQISKPKYAETLDKAKDAMRSAVETFVEAAGWVPKVRHPHASGERVVGWREGE